MVTVQSSRNPTDTEIGFRYQVEVNQLGGGAGNPRRVRALLLLLDENSALPSS